MRYKESFDRYIAAKGYAIKTLVAFSGVVVDELVPDKKYTEEGMNGGIREKELPERFATAEYQVLLVAEKYQTGFDQPLLHTMYIDRRLDGIRAVQTLSRLNRVHPLKEDTFVLDFVNDRQEIQAAFKQFYEGAEIGEQVEPARMYEIRAELDASGIYLDVEVDRFCAVYFKPKARQSSVDHREMNSALDPAVDRFRKLQESDDDAAELWRGKLAAFRNLYSFLSQIIPYQDSDLERLYTFLRHLSAKLPKRRSGPQYSFDDDVRLEYYRLQKISEGSIGLTDGQAEPLDGPQDVGSAVKREKPVALSTLIDLINERFGTDFTDADQLFFDQIVEAAVADEGLKQAAQANPEDKFALVFNRALESLFVERMEQNEDIFAKFMNDVAFQKLVTAWMVSEAYRRIRTAAAPVAPDSGLQSSAHPFRIVQPDPNARYVSCVPLVPLKAAAGQFGDPQSVDDSEFEWVAIKSQHRLRRGMFVAQVVGKSMEPVIPDGAYCLFAAPVAGTRQGKIVLAQLLDAVDEETGQRYTVKRYDSTKAKAGDSWQHTEIRLLPANPAFSPIVLTGSDDRGVSVIAEFIEVLSA